MQIILNDTLIPAHCRLMRDVLKHNYTHYTIYGGRGGAKSSFIGIAIPLLITQHKDCHAVVFRKVANTLRDSVYAQISFGISLLGLTEYFNFKVSPMEITFKPTGQKIIFRGADEPEKIKSLKAPFGYFGVTWFEELDQFHGREETRNILQSTMRGGSLFWNFESFNPPISNLNWVNKDLDEDRADRITVKSCYLDVPVEWLGQQFLDEAEHLKSVNEKAYRHEYLGEAVGTGGMVFENVVKREITNEEIKQFDHLYFGIDWGWFPDPTAFVKCYFNASQRKLYIFDEFKANKTNNIEIAGLLKQKGITAQDMLICDNSDNKSIADLKEHGFYARATEKGAGSVVYSMKWLQGLTEIVIDPKRCPNAAEEFLVYEYERTKDGEIISAYPDKNNHFIDATRYALNMVWRARGQ